MLKCTAPIKKQMNITVLVFSTPKLAIWGITILERIGWLASDSTPNQVPDRAPHTIVAPLSTNNREKTPPGRLSMVSRATSVRVNRTIP